MSISITTMLKNGTSTTSELIPVSNIGRAAFMSRVRDFLIELNKMFKQKTGTYIWHAETDIISGSIFNGTASFIMNPSLSDEDIASLNQTAGDIDVSVPEYLKSELWAFLKSLENKEVITGVRYVGCNSMSEEMVANQLSTIFVIDFDGVRCNCKVDFDFMPYLDGRPVEWYKFAASSSVEDAKLNLKSLHHKYLIRALISGASLRRDILVCTGSSTATNVSLSKSIEHMEPRMLSFSLSHGVRVAYEPLLDASGKQVRIGNKDVYKAVPTNKSDFITSVMGVFSVAFKNPNPTDFNKFTSFAGVVDLMKKYLTKDQIAKTVERYKELLWSPKPHAVEVSNDQRLDYEIKMNGYKYLLKNLHLRDRSSKMIDDYYERFGKNKVSMSESFIEWLEDNEALLLNGEEP